MSDNPQIKVEEKIADAARDLPMTGSNVETTLDASGSEVAGTVIGETRNGDARFFAALIDNIDGGITVGHCVSSVSIPYSLFSQT